MNEYISANTETIDVLELGNNWELRIYNTKDSESDKLEPTYISMHENNGGLIVTTAFQKVKSYRHIDLNQRSEP